MDKYPLLKEVGGLIKKCVLCGGCHSQCPTYDLSRYEQDAARGKVVLAEALLKGDIEPDANLAQKFNHCLTCMACVDTCPAGADPVKVITAARIEIAQAVNGKGLFGNILRKILPNRNAFSAFVGLSGIATKIFSALPATGVMPFVRQGIKKKLPKFGGKSLKSEFPEVISPKKRIMRVGYFMGCMTDRVFHDTGRAVIETLVAAGAEVVLYGNEVCCGAPAWFSGDRETAAIVARENCRVFMSRDVDFIVTSCATCGSVLKDVYPGLPDVEGAERFSGKIIDYQQLLSEHLWDRLEFTQPSESVKVTYHDPCHLSRGMKVTKPPRRLLDSLPGVEYVEMDEASRCCGGSGTFSLKYYDDALEIGRKKAESVKATGARYVATACPACRMQLLDTLNRYCAGAEVVHTAILIRERLI